MNKQELLRKIKAKAKIDERNRHDPRFLETCGFLVAKGFLKTNMDVPLLPNKRIRLDDALWAGQHVEPRILEVLPAAVLRLEKHFDFDPLRYPDLAETIEHLRQGDKKGPEFRGMPFEKLRQWVNFPLPDKRMKKLAEKKILKTFRLDPRAVARLKEMAKKKGVTETELVEGLIVGNSN